MSEQKNLGYPDCNVCFLQCSLAFTIEIIINTFSQTRLVLKYSSCVCIVSSIPFQHSLFLEAFNCTCFWLSHLPFRACRRCHPLSLPFTLPPHLPFSPQLDIAGDGLFARQKICYSPRVPGLMKFSQKPSEAAIKRLKTSMI